MTGTTTGSRSTGVGTQPGSSSGDSVAAKAQSAVGTATEKAKDTSSELTHKASEQAGTAAHKIADKADDRKAELAAQARTLQDKMREFATSIGEEQPKVGEVVEQAADRAGAVIDWVENTPVEDMTQELNAQLRRHPMLFAAGMFGAGFALTRALKPVDPAASSGSSTAGTPQLETAPTQTLPAASAIDGGMH